MPSAEAKRYLLAAYGERNQVTLEGGRKAPMAPGRQAVAEAMDQLEAMAHAGPRRPAPALRVGGDGARLVIDLCRDDYTVVVVEDGGWQVVEAEPDRDAAGARACSRCRCPCRARATRSATCAACSVSTARSTTRSGRCSSASCSRRCAPSRRTSCSASSGEQGTGKTTTATDPARRVDPHEADIQPKPKSEDDLFVNCRRPVAHRLRQPVSTLDQHWSDAFCRISTGTGVLASASCTPTATRCSSRWRGPQIITAIVDVVAAPDLLDRSLLAQQPELGDGDRRRGGAAGGGRARWRRACSASCSTPRRSRSAPEDGQAAHGPAHGRADAVGRGGAPRCSGWRPGQFLDAYLDSQARAGEMALEASLIGAPLLDMLDGRDALAALAEQEGEPTPARRVRGHGQGPAQRAERVHAGQAAPGPGLAADAAGMSGALRRIAPALRKLGYGVEFGCAGATGRHRNHDRHPALICPPFST